MMLDVKRLMLDEDFGRRIINDKLGNHEIGFWKRVK
jgi:hypothetical protein